MFGEDGRPSLQLWKGEVCCEGTNQQERYASSYQIPLSPGNPMTFQRKKRPEETVEKSNSRRKAGHQRPSRGPKTEALEDEQRI